MGIFVFDPLTGDPTITSANRAKRPNMFSASKTENLCIFCKGNEALTPTSTYQDSDDWNVRTFDNKFPLMPDHEIIVHSPLHDKDIENLPHEQNVRLIRAYLNRTSHYGQQDKEVLIFNNKGGRAGASITHSHSQIVAAKGFPGIMEKEKESALKYFNEKKSCYWCDEIYEAVSSKRLIHESSHFVVFVPKACRWSYEMVLAPKNHKPNFGFIDEMEINDLAYVLKGALNSYSGAFEGPDRNFWIHTQRYEPYHWHIGFIPHIKVFGALELGAGIWVSDKATPEDSATKLKEFFNSSD